MPELAGSDAADRLGFTVGDALYAVPTAAVTEVLRPRPLTRVPHAPPSLLGVANLRGTILPVASAARLLGGAQAEATPASRVLVLAHHPPCGLLVDAVKGLIREPARPFDAPALLAAGVVRNAKPRQAPASRKDAPSAPTVDRDASALAVLGFIIAGQAYALPLESVVEVVPAGAEPTRVAGADPAVVGLLSHRGAVLPVVSLSFLLGRGHDRGGGPLVVTRLSGGTVALAVDALRAIARVPSDRLDAVPPVLTRGSGETRVDRIARGDDGTLVAILSPAKLFDEATETRLAGMAGGHRQAEASVAEDDARERFVVFRLGGEEYGLPIASVEEVVRYPARLSPLPRGPAFVLGVMNLRGTPVPVLDGRGRLGARPAGAAGNRVIVVTMGGVRAGFAVDEVSRIVDVPARAIARAPDFVRAEGGEAFGRIADHDGRLMVLVEPEALLAEAERDAVAAAAKARKPAAVDAC